MFNKKSCRRLCIVQGIAFLVVIVFLWMEEVLDLPAKLGGMPTPINWLESFMETVVISVLGSFTIVLTYTLQKRITMLQSFIVMCSYCRKVKVDGKWQNLEHYLQSKTATRFSHGMCPDCAKEHWGLDPDNPVITKIPDDEK